MGLEIPRDVEAVAEALTRLFDPHVEVVVHDLESDSIAGIWNPVSGRRRLDPSLIEPEFVNRDRSSSVIGPYAQTTIRGESTLSISMLVDEDRLMLCINLDRAGFEALALRSSDETLPRDPGFTALFSHDWRASLNHEVSLWCATRNVAATALARDQYAALIEHLTEIGLYFTRAEAAYVAQMLGVPPGALPPPSSR